MDMNYEIVKVQGREILDSRGNPTVEAEVWLEGGAMGRASVPSGASTGAFEAAELRDGGGRYMGKGVKKAAEHVGNELAEAVMFESVLNQRRIDGLLLEAEGSPNKERMGANAVLAVSMACARAAANALGIPLYRHLGGVFGSRLPVPMMNILNGGKHADNTVDLQEFMIMPSGAECFSENLRMCAEIYHTLKGLLKRDGYGTAVGDEGGFAPNLNNSEEALEYLVRAIRETGYEPGTDVKIAIDAAASELYNKQTGLYEFPGESAMSGRRVCRTAAGDGGVSGTSGGQVPHLLHRGRAGGGGLGRLAASYKAFGKPDPAGGRRSVCYQFKAAGKGDRASCRECHFDQNESDRHPYGDDGGGCPGKAGGIRHDHFPPLRRDGGLLYRGSGGGGECRTDQDRGALPGGADGQIQPAVKNRRRDWKN